MDKTLLSPWQISIGGQSLNGTGQRSLLGEPMQAFFASRICPGSAIRAATEWAATQAKAKAVVISGFHSPLERSVLEMLLVAKSPAIVVLARDAHHATLFPAWQQAAAQGYLAVISECSNEKSSPRLTNEPARVRNNLIAALASKICVAYASPSGTLVAQVTQWQEAGRVVLMLQAR